MMMHGLYDDGPLHNYVHIMEGIMREHMEDIAGTQRPIDCMMRLRLMAARSSQESFVGPYLAAAERDELAELMLVYTMGFLSFPLPWIPGSGLYKAIHATRRMQDILEVAFLKAQAYVQGGGEPRCVVDHWCDEIEKARLRAEERCARGEEERAEIWTFFTSRHWAETTMDTLFASQDATTSALTWTVDILARHPAVLAKCRSEIDGLLAAAKSQGQAQPTLAEVYPRLSYIRDVAHEVLRYKPPVPMLPHVTRHDIVVRGTPMRAGTMVIAAIEKAASPSIFDPENNTDKGFDTTLTFGAGPHKCPGRFYAITSVALYASLLAADYDITPAAPNAEDTSVYFPTLFPKFATFSFARRAAATK
jgi:cytochrome P450